MLSFTFTLAVHLWASYLTSLTLKVESPNLNLVCSWANLGCSHGRVPRQHVEGARSQCVFCHFSSVTASGQASPIGEEGKRQFEEVRKERKEFS